MSRMKTFRLMPFLVLLFGCLIFSGCSIYRTNKELREREDMAKTNITTLQNTARGNDTLGRGLKPFVSRSDSYINADAQRIESGRERLRGRTIKLTSNDYLAGIGDIISRSTGIPVRYSPELSKVKHLKDMQINLKFSGQLSELLDIVSTYFSIYWEMTDQGNILFFAQKTKTFSVAAFLADANIETNVSNESDSSDDESSEATTSGGASGTTKQVLKTKGANTPFNEVLSGVQNMLTENDTVVSNRSLGSITVTASPVVLSRVDEYIRNLNARYTRQVALNVNIYSFSTTTGLDLGYNLDVMFKNSDVEILGSGAMTAVTGAGQFSATILEGASKNWAGSKGVLQALKANGKVSTVNSASGLTMNNQSLPIQALQRTGYLASSSSTLSGDVSEVTLEPGQVVTGLSVLVTPHILPDDRILIEYSMNYSILNKIDEISSGNSTIQTPQTDSRTIFQRVTVRPGSTIILAGLTTDILGQDTNFGVFHTGYNNNDQMEYLVIVIDVSDATLTERR